MPDKRMAINVTFKSTEEELYKWCIDHSSPSAFIKDVLREKMDNKQTANESGIIRRIEF